MAISHFKCCSHARRISYFASKANINVNVIPPVLYYSKQHVYLENRDTYRFIVRIRGNPRNIIQIYVIHLLPPPKNIYRYIFLIPEQIDALNIFQSKIIYLENPHSLSLRRKKKEFVYIYSAQRVFR